MKLFFIVPRHFKYTMFPANQWSMPQQLLVIANFVQSKIFCSFTNWFEMIFFYPNVFDRKILCFRLWNFVKLLGNKYQYFLSLIFQKIDLIANITDSFVLILIPISFFAVQFRLFSVTRAFQCDEVLSTILALANFGHMTQNRISFIVSFQPKLARYWRGKINGRFCGKKTSLMFVNETGHCSFPIQKVSSLQFKFGGIGEHFSLPLKVDINKTVTITFFQGSLILAG